MTYRQDLWEIAAGQHGVFTVPQAEDAGVPAVEVRKLAARGVMRGYGQGVYRHTGVPLTSGTQPYAAVALAGQDAFLVADAVLALQGLGHLNPSRIRVATPARVRRSLPDWMRLERRRDVPAEDVGTVEGIPAASTRVALQDVASDVDPQHLTLMVRQALQRELIGDTEASALLLKADAS